MIRGKTFSAAMVRALIAVRKTQTRRLATPSARAAAGAAGGSIYVREHWATAPVYDRRSPRTLIRAMGILNIHPPLYYLADFSSAQLSEIRAATPALLGRHRQAMHMPRASSRLTLHVNEVRIEKLMKINDQDAIAEGIAPFPFPPDRPPAWKTHEDSSIAYEEPRAAYMALWNSLHTEPGETWHDNPDVIVTTFTVHHGNVDQRAS